MSICPGVMSTQAVNIEGIPNNSLLYGQSCDWSSEPVLIARVTEQQQIKQPKSSKYNHPDGPQSSKRLISKACREVLLNPDATPKQKLQASAILERILRLKYLASHRFKRKAKNTSSKRSTGLADLLEHAS